jgi:hypothetical protein
MKSPAAEPPTMPIRVQISLEPFCHVNADNGLTQAIKMLSDRTRGVKRPHSGAAKEKQRALWWCPDLLY